MDRIKFVFDALGFWVSWAITAAIVVLIVLVLVRLALNYADLNPFSRPVLLVRQWTDPLINPVRRALAGFGFSPNIAPLVTILLAILVGYLAQMLALSVIETVRNVLVSVLLKRPVLVIGHLLFGLLGMYGLLIFIRIIFSWGMVGYGNRVMRFLVNATEPLLGPLRRMIPPLGFIDISPIVAFLIIWLFQAAIAGTLLRAG